MQAPVTSNAPDPTGAPPARAAVASAVPGAADARRVFALQQATRWSVAASTADARSARLARLKRVILAHRPALHEALWADLHRHPAEVDLAEVQPTLTELEHARRQLGRWMRPRRVSAPLLLTGTTSEVRYEPRGSALIVAPWNYPFLLLLTPLVAAVAAGTA